MNKNSVYSSTEFSGYLFKNSLMHLVNKHILFSSAYW